MTSTRQLDTADLQARVKQMYEQVATDPHQTFTDATDAYGVTSISLLAHRA